MHHLNLQIEAKKPTDLQIPVSSLKPGFRLSFSVTSNPLKGNLATSRLVSFTCESATAFLFIPALRNSKYMEGFTLILPSSFYDPSHFTAQAFSFPAMIANDVIGTPISR